MKIDDPDHELNIEQMALVKQLTEDEIEYIDKALLSFARRKYYRKTAYLIGMMMTRFSNRVAGIPDIFYGERESTQTG